MGLKNIRSQLADLEGRALITAGGTVIVCTEGSSLKATLKNADGSTLANPITPTRGMIDFYVADTVAAVDLYGMSASGHAFQKASVAVGDNEIRIETTRKRNMLVIPFHTTDMGTPAATEYDTGFDTGVDKAWLSGPYVNVVTPDTSITLDVGTDGSGANDPNGFIEAIAMGTVARVKTTVVTTHTLGALLFVQDSANTLDRYPEAYIETTDESITMTLLTAHNTAAGFVHLPYDLL